MQAITGRICQFLALCIGLYAPAVGAEPRVPRGAESLKLRLQQVSPDPLPYQAVRIRLTLRNEGGPEVEGLTQPTGSTYFLKIPSGTFREVHKAAQQIGDELPIDGAVVRNGNIVLRLMAGEEISASIPIAADWYEHPKSDPPKRVLFAIPGKYQIKALYPISYPVDLPVKHDLKRFPDGYDSSRFLGAVVTVAVREPTGNDQTICELLRNNQDLAFVMLSTVQEPEDDLIPVLEQIVARYPDSSYADYARFALARKILKGTGYYWFREEYSRERFARNMQIAIFQSKRNDDELYHTMDNDPFLLGKLSSAEEKVVRRVIAARSKSEVERNNALADLVDLLYISKSERRQAIRLLVQILDNDFAYLPNVLASLRIALGDMDPEWTARIDHEMNSRFYDSLVWVKIKQRELGAGREWHDFRIRVRKP